MESLDTGVLNFAKVKKQSRKRTNASKSHSISDKKTMCIKSEVFDLTGEITATTMTSQQQ